MLGTCSTNGMVHPSATSGVGFEGLGMYGLGNIYGYPYKL